MLQRFNRFFFHIASKVEQNPASFPSFLCLYIAILTIRLTLEFFSSRRLFMLEDVLHIGLWFTFIVQAFLLQMHLFSREKVLKIAKLVITFFSIALSAPILDLILTGGVGAKMNYLSLQSWQDIGWSYITIGGSSLSKGATPGIRIEIVLLVLASFNYIRLKRNSWQWAVLGAWSIYTVLFLSGAVPLFLGYLVDAFHLQYTTDDQSTVLLLLLLNLLLFLIIAARHFYHSPLLRFFSVPWREMSLGMMLAIAGALNALALYPDNWKLTPTTLFWFPLLAYWFILMTICTGLQRVSSAQTTAIRYALFIIMAGISAMIQFRTLYASMLIWAIYFISSEPPLRLGDNRWLRSLLTGMSMTAWAIFGFCTFGGPMIGFPPSWILIITTGGAFVSILADIFFKKNRF